MFGFVLTKLILLMLVEGRRAEGPLAIGSPLGVHLQEPQIDAKLDLFLAVFSNEFSHHYLARVIFPFIQDVRDVKIHFCNMNCQYPEVNATWLQVPQPVGSPIRLFEGGVA